MVARANRLVALALALAMAMAALAIASRAVHAQGTRPHVVVVPLEGTIDLGVAPYVARVLGEAERGGASAVIVAIDTFGGRLDAAVSMRDALLESRVPTVAFVEGRAISAGALVALATETIAMRPGATIGAATPVQLQPDGAALPVDEKTVSYVRKEFKATAEQRGRPAELAEAMVDRDVDVPGVVGAGKLLTLTTDEALAVGMADMEAASVSQVLDAIGLGGAEVRTAKPHWAEHAVRGITHPIVSSLLMALGMLGLFVEIRTPGFGVPGIAGVLCLALFFGGHWIARLAGIEELVLIGAGVVLLALEVFVVPGFGFTGIAGIACLALGLGLSVVGSGAAPAALLASLGRVAIAFVVAVVGFLALLAILPRTPLARGIVLEAQLAPASFPAPSAGEARASSLVGAHGVALTPLRPSGIARFGEERVDVVSDGDLVPEGTPVEAIAHEGHRVVVRALELEPERSA